MAMLTGEVMPLNRLDPMIHAVGATVLVKLGRKTVASGVVNDAGMFEIELPDDLRGEIEVELGLQNAAPTLTDADGNDRHVTLIYSNVNNFIA